MKKIIFLAILGILFLLIFAMRNYNNNAEIYLKSLDVPQSERIPLQQIGTSKLPNGRTNFNRNTIIGFCNISLKNTRIVPEESTPEQACSCVGDYVSTKVYPAYIGAFKTNFTARLQHLKNIKQSNSEEKNAVLRKAYGQQRHKMLANSGLDAETYKKFVSLSVIGAQMRCNIK